MAVHEDHPYFFEYHAKTLIEQRNIVKEKYNIEVNFFFHNRETSISDSPVAGNIFNAV